MSIQAVLLPVFVQVFLTWIVGFTLAARRTAAFKSGTKYRDIALREPNWPQPALQAQYSFANQFELPVLFFAACLTVHALGATSAATVALAWVFVASRYVHAAIHITTNRIRHRQPAFVVGYVALAVIWAIIVWRLAAG